MHKEWQQSPILLVPSAHANITGIAASILFQRKVSVSAKHVSKGKAREYEETKWEVPKNKSQGDTTVAIQKALMEKTGPVLLLTLGYKLLAGLHTELLADFSFIPIKRQAAELSLAVTVPEPSAQKAFATSPLATAVVTAGRRLQRVCHHKAQGRSGSKGDMRAGLVIKEEKAEVTILEAVSSCPKRI